MLRIGLATHEQIRRSLLVI